MKSRKVIQNNISIEPLIEDTKCITCGHAWEDHSHCGRKRMCCASTIGPMGYLVPVCRCKAYKEK